MSRTEPFDLRNLLDLAPEALHPQLVVAGGYLASPHLAKDIDLWLLAGEDTQEALRDIHQHLAPQIVAAWAGQPEAFTLFSLHPAMQALALPPPEYEGNLQEKGHFYVGTFQRPGWPLPVQFFVTPYETAEQLLEDFDISTHQRAAVLVETDTEHPWRGLYVTSTTTAIGALPRVTNWSTPSTTLARLEKISTRYGFSLGHLHPDVDKLRALIIGSVQYETAA